MHDTFGGFLFHREAASFEHSQHPPVFLQNLGMKLRNAFVLRNPGEMSEGDACDAETLVVFLDHERHLRAALAALPAGVMMLSLWVSLSA
jgi:hypothetical protein